MNRIVNTKTIFSIVIVLILLVIIRNIVSSILQTQANSTIVDDLKTQYTNEQKRGEFLKQRLYYVQTNDFIENQAREKLGMALPGEHIVLAPPATTSALPTVTRESQANWEKWWQLFF